MSEAVKILARKLYDVVPTAEEETFLYLVQSCLFTLYKILFLQAEQERKVQPDQQFPLCTIPTSSFKTQIPLQPRFQKTKHSATMLAYTVPAPKL